MVIVKNVGRILPLLLLLFAFSSCSRKYKIEGSSSVTSLDGKMLYLKIFDDDKLVTVDSAEVVHGLFSMKGKIDSVMVVTLYMGNEGLMPLVLEDGKVKEFPKGDIEMVDADVNVEIDIPNINTAYAEEEEHIDIKQLEDDKNSSTGNI